MKKLLLFTFSVLLFASNLSSASAENESTAPQNTIQTKGIIPAADPNDPESNQSQFAQKVADGTLELNDLPLVIIYWIDWLTWLAGSIAVIFLIIGGYQYIFGGLTDDKENGKKTFLYAVSGLIVVFFSWIAINLIQGWLTSGLQIT